jgi:hypothetical protein
MTGGLTLRHLYGRLSLLLVLEKIAPQATSDGFDGGTTASIR